MLKLFNLYFQWPQKRFDVFKCQCSNLMLLQCCDAVCKFLQFHLTGMLQISNSCSQHVDAKFQCWWWRWCWRCWQCCCLRAWSRLRFPILELHLLPHPLACGYHCAIPHSLAKLVRPFAKGLLPVFRSFSAIGKLRFDARRACNSGAWGGKTIDVPRHLSGHARDEASAARRIHSHVVQPAISATDDAGHRWRNKLWGNAFKCWEPEWHEQAC